jgi:hypothetical protein
MLIYHFRRHTGGCVGHRRQFGTAEKWFKSDHDAIVYGEFI